MTKTMSPEQIEANRLNAQKSTGPKTPQGKAASRLNAFKHGLRSSDVVIRASCLREDKNEFAALRDRLFDDLKPVGALEEMLVDQIITTHWRLRRALKAESGEIALSVDSGQDARSKAKFDTSSWFVIDPINKSVLDPVPRMKESALGNSLLLRLLEKLRGQVEEQGDITAAALKSLNDHFSGIPNELAREIEAFRARLRQNEDGLPPDQLKEKALRFLDGLIEEAFREKSRRLQREKIQETCRQAAQALPAPEILGKCLRYIAPLERQLFQAMNQLDRLQQRRLGQKTPPPPAAPAPASEPPCFSPNEPILKTTNHQ